MNPNSRHSKQRSTKQVIYEALPGATYRLKDRAYIVDSRGCIRRVDIPKELRSENRSDSLADKVSFADEAISADKRKDSEESFLLSEASS